MRWNGSMKTKACICEEFLTAAPTALTGQGNKSEVTLQAPLYQYTFLHGQLCIDGGAKHGAEQRVS